MTDAELDELLTEQTAKEQESPFLTYEQIVENEAATAADTAGAAAFATAGANAFNGFNTNGTAPILNPPPWPRQGQTWSGPGLGGKIYYDDDPWWNWLIF